MVSDIRRRYNETFSEEKYQAFLTEIEQANGHRPPFPIAETPVFVSRQLGRKLLEACDELLPTFLHPDFKSLSEETILPGTFVPGENAHPTFLCIDFGITLDQNGEPHPQLIEIQGFPSLFFYQHLCARAYRNHFDVPDGWHHLFGGLDEEAYYQWMRRVIVGDARPENVVLLEIEPWQQNTRIDFLETARILGVAVKCISELKTSGRDVYYIADDGRKIGVERIYNRVIFDELSKRQDLLRDFDFSTPYDVSWVGHPHWFSRISKHTLPLFRSRYAPPAHYLHNVDPRQTDLAQFVLKPLYSFSGQGVVIHPTIRDVEAIPEDDRKNFILQRKVTYAPLIATPDGPAKVEIRLMLTWEDGRERPTLVTNLARLSKGEMVGVRYNKGKSWVGGSVCFFEPA